MSTEHSPGHTEVNLALPRNADPLLDEAAAGVYIGGVSERTLQRWRFERAGPAYIKIGRLIRYRRSGLDAFLAAGEQKPAT